MPAGTLQPSLMAASSYLASSDELTAALSGRSPPFQSLGGLTVCISLKQLPNCMTSPERNAVDRLFADQMRNLHYVNRANNVFGREERKSILVPQD